MSQDPSPGKPYMPGYDGMHRADSKPISWPTALQRFNAARNYWLSTVRPDGRPHTMPVWGLWFEGAFYFSTSPASRKAQNIATNARCTVATDQATEAVIIEGAAAPERNVDLIRRLLEPYEAKYDWKMDPEDGSYFRVKPSVAFAFTEGAAAGGENNPTRFVFGG